MSSAPRLSPEIESFPLPPRYERKAQPTEQELWDGRDGEEENEEEEVPFGRICLTVCLLFVGVAVMVYGVIEEVKSPMPAKGVPFWIIGTLILIPACYCVYDLTTLWRRDRQSAHRQLQEVSGF